MKFFKYFFPLVFIFQMAFSISYNEEFQVNTYTSVHWDDYVIVSLSNGNFVICWSGIIPDVPDREIYAQLYNETGEKVGEEIQVNSNTESYQYEVDAIALSDKKFVVCWQGLDNESSYGICAQIFSETGTKLGEEIQVNSYTENFQLKPEIALLSDGKFIICWKSDNQDGSEEGVYAQIFSNSGEKIGKEFQVNTYVKDQQLNPQIFLLSNSNFIICWDSYGQDGSWYGIYAQIFSETGEKVGDEFQVNTYTLDTQGGGKINSLYDGNFIIYWESQEQDGSWYGVYAQIFNEKGEKIGEEIQVNTFTKDYQVSPDIAVLSDKKYVICWHSYGWGDDAQSGIYAQFFNDLGDKVGNEFKVSSDGERSQSEPRISALSDDRFLICWNSGGQDGSGNGVFAQLFDDKGEKIGKEFQVNRYAKDDQSNPEILLLSDGKIIICWQSGKWGSRYELFAKYYLSEVLSHTLSDFSLQTPQVEETIYTLLPSFEWKQPSDIHVNFPWEITYDLYLSETSDFASPFVYTDIIDTTYTIPDELNRNQIYFWKVLAHTWEGDSLWSSDVGGFFVSATAAIDDEMSIPSEFKLHHCYPNPFNATTTIRYDLPKNRNVKVLIYNSLGKKMELLVNEFQQAGSYNYSWTANNLPSGIYFISVEADNFSDVTKCVLLK